MYSPVSNLYLCNTYSIQVYRYTGIQIYRYTDIQVYRYTGYRAAPYRAIRGHTGIQVYRRYTARMHGPGRRMHAAQRARCTARLLHAPGGLVPGSATGHTGIQVHPGIQVYRLLLRVPPLFLSVLAKKSGFYAKSGLLSFCR